ncbi:DUF1190 domain-containing protein [Agarivorans sp. MS3-6]|uniref:DUF1190 domain-containing protein n=1 Tax=Agarivorans sp. TSD2052 TaxID=2937286 RepID=UPI00200EB178|nr:DUF1190 domain-containing protein [Agarivorans sp. TSD2052]UPW17681.1 DUF1190 domain-containing protein [Agarivorans sp. TSD2052]
MKRSKFINLAAMRKLPAAKPSFLVKPLVVAVSAAMLSACSEPQDDAIVIESVDDCVTKTTLNQQQCVAVYQNAEAEAARTAPKYNNRQDCEETFGYEGCRASSNGIFTPIMYGYLFGRMMDTSRPSSVYKYNQRGSSYRDSIITADGSVIGKAGQRGYKVNRSAYDSKPTVTRTVSRGGFGAKASAKSSWGGSKSSWGG